MNSEQRALCVLLAWLGLKCTEGSNWLNASLCYMSNTEHTCTLPFYQDQDKYLDLSIFHVQAPSWSWLVAPLLSSWTPPRNKNTWNTLGIKNFQAKKNIKVQKWSVKVKSLLQCCTVLFRNVQCFMLGARSILLSGRGLDSIAWAYSTYQREGNSAWSQVYSNIIFLVNCAVKCTGRIIVQWFFMLSVQSG